MRVFRSLTPRTLLGGAVLGLVFIVLSATPGFAVPPNIVIGPQGVCEEARVTGTYQGLWLGREPTGGRLTWNVVIFFPWDEGRKLFRGEKVYADVLV